MDIVDTFNHLIPSDQLDDSLIISQNLECDVSNELRPGPGLEDSLKNMLSDKDPMFGCASSQFNLLENEDATFQMSGSTGADDGELMAAKTTPVKRPVGRPRKRPCNLETDSSGEPEPTNTPTDTMTRARPGRKPTHRLQKSFLIEKGVRGVQLKKELTLGGRINVNDLHGGLWLKPSVVLKRLTVTIGGFKIELLPGPSYIHNADASLDGCFPYAGDIEFAVLPDNAVSVQNPVSENMAEVDVPEKSSGDEPLALGPYVNPNDVQTANGTEIGSPAVKDTNVDLQSVSGKEKADTDGKGDIKESENDGNTTTTAGNEMVEKEKQQTTAKTVLKSKQGLPANRNKSLNSSKPSNIVKESKVLQSPPCKTIQRDLPKVKSPKEKKGNEPLKRSGDCTPSEPAPKVHRAQSAADVKAKPKSPSSAAKKIPLSSTRAADPHSPTKPTHSHSGSRSETANPAQGQPGHPLKALEEGGQEKAKTKKPEKILQRQKSKIAKSISVDEPQLFIPDNAPVIKRESVEEPPVNSESVWDGNNCCGLCKKHHNNMFMVGCGRCDDWFHGDCVGLDLTKVREMEEEDQMYVCLKCCEEESKKVEPETLSTPPPENPAKPQIQEHKTTPKPKPGPSQSLASGGVRPVRKDPDRRQSTDGREAPYKTGNQLKRDSRSKTSSSSKKPVSVEEIRRSVRDSLREILVQRLKESGMNISVERASEVAKKTERELFHMYKDTENKYKNKYRSLMFNLKDTKNNVLFKKVLKGEISPSNLIRMSPEELASKELAAWRQRENRHTIEMIEKEQREAERRPITKITHKGEIEIESQEPVKAPEPTEPESPPRATEPSAEPPKTPEKNTESTKTEKDTTEQHKSHLFDLHCKICTGRMAPPVKEAPTKVVKVATTVVRRQSTKAEEVKSTKPPAAKDELHLNVLEESFRNAHTGLEGRSDPTVGKDEVATFLSSLKSLWRGFIHMHSVAKMVTKAFPVSGILDNLTQDLPDSIQVGGRISPQTVWDYLEKIRATGTKEVCLIRFSPETEEDEISYTLLYAYFSSRRRFGVVSNNLKQVKDMYLIPLGATEKVPHQLVPFDGPGLESNRSNLLLGLVIRQRPKRDFLPVDMNEEARVSPEVKPIAVSTKAAEEDEKLFLSSLTAVHKKEDKQPNANEDTDKPITESFEEPSVSEETNSLEPQKPLRFLPGVLVGWGGELPPLPDFGGKPLAADTAPKTQTKTEAPSAGTSKSPTTAAPRERFVIKKKEVKPAQSKPEIPSQTAVSATNGSSGKEAATATAAPQSEPLSLKDKPPDVSTETFLASLSTTRSETSSATSTNKGSAEEKGSSESQAAPDQTNSSKPPLSGILKKSSAYSGATEDKTTVLQKDKTSHVAPLSPKPLPLASSSRNDTVTLFHQGYLQISQAREKSKEQTPVGSLPNEKEDPSVSLVGATATPAAQPPPTECSASTRTEASELQQDAAAAAAAAAAALPATNSAAHLSPQPQVPGSHNSTSGPPPNPPNRHVQDQNHAVPRAQDGALHAPPGAEPEPPESHSEPSGRPAALAKDHKRLEERYCDPWERPRHTEDRDHHGRHSHHRDSHHGKKSRHHDREREKKHDRDDKHRDRSRHRGHSDDRYGERRKERVHSDEHSSRHKDRHRHRRDSDYENGRRGSKDSYS